MVKLNGIWRNNPRKCVTYLLLMLNSGIARLTIVSSLKLRQIEQDPFNTKTVFCCFCCCCQTVMFI